MIGTSLTFGASLAGLLCAHATNSLHLPGSKFLFNPRGVGLSDSHYEVKAEVLLANWNLSAHRLATDVMAMVAFTLLCLTGTFVVLARSQFRR